VTEQYYPPETTVSACQYWAVPQRCELPLHQ